MDPAQYFAALEYAKKSARRAHPYGGRLVDDTKTSDLFSHCDVVRQDGLKLRVVPEFVACLYDVTVLAAMEILCVNERTFRRLRVWCGATRWPRTEMLLGKHPLLTNKMVHDHRVGFMREAHGVDPLAYSILHRAHGVAGYSLAGFPLPEAVEPRGRNAQECSEPRGRKAQECPEQRRKAQARVRPEFLPAPAEPEQEAAEPHSPTPEPSPGPSPDPEFPEPDASGPGLPDDFFGFGPFDQAEYEAEAAQDPEWQAFLGQLADGAWMN